MRVVVTGANRGIGLELARQLVTRGDEVDAGVRRPAEARELAELASRSGGKLGVHALDVADDASVRAFAAALAPGPVDLLINNAGVGGHGEGLEDLDLENVVHVFHVNTLGPIRVTRALLPRLREGRTRKVVHVTSKMGSIDDNGSGGAYAYRMSKAALNMASRSMSVDLRGEGVISVVINPGWVQTDMGGAHAPTPVRDSVAAMLRIADGLLPEDSGAFFDWTGERVPW